MVLSCAQVRARLEHHRNLQEEVHKEVQQRTQALGHLEREIKELLVMRPVGPRACALVLLRCKRRRRPGAWPSRWTRVGAWRWCPT